MSGKSTLKILIAHEFVMGRWVVFGKIISTVVFSGRPIKIELLLSNAIFEPVVAHVKGFRFFHSDLRMENTVSCRVVGLQRSRGVPVGGWGWPISKRAVQM